MIALENPGPSLTGEQLTEFEQEIGVTLPHEYREFLLSHNGGKPNPDHFRFGTKSESVVHRFYTLDSSPTGLRACYYSFHSIPPRMPAEILAIGTDPGGNQICLATFGEKAGFVYFWDHEKEGQYGHRVHYRNLHLISDSFSLFVENLFAVTPEETRKFLEPYTILQNQDIQGLENYLQSGFDINAKLSNGLTFLENAAIYDDVIVAEYLLSKGSAIGKAKEIATRAGRLGILRLIKSSEM